jgi:hypothetical protein
MNYTSSLPAELLELLESYARKFRIPKNRIMELALRAYFEKLKKAEYARSFLMASGKHEVLNTAEEGPGEYLKILDKDETA